MVNSKFPNPWERRKEFRGRLVSALAMVVEVWIWITMGSSLFPIPRRDSARPKFASKLIPRRLMICKASFCISSNVCWRIRFGFPIRCWRNWRLLRLSLLTLTLTLRKLVSTLQYVHHEAGKHAYQQCLSEWVTMKKCERNLESFHFFWEQRLDNLICLCRTIVFRQGVTTAWHLFTFLTVHTLFQASRWTNTGRRGRID